MSKEIYGVTFFTTDGERYTQETVEHEELFFDKAEAEALAEKYNARDRARARAALEQRNRETWRKDTQAIIENNALIEAGLRSGTPVSPPIAPAPVTDKAVESYRRQNDWIWNYGVETLIVHEKGEKS